MSDPCEDICDAILVSLNAAQDDPETQFSLAFTSDRPEDPNAELDKPLDTLRVLVWPHGKTEAKIGRGGQVLETFQVAMLVYRRMDVSISRQDLAGFMREVEAWLRGKRMAGKVYSGKETTLTDLDELHEHKLYMCASIVSYVGTA